MNDESPDALLNIRLGGYRLTRKLGAGGFGAVYLGEPDVGDPKAIKVLHDHGMVDMLRKEAQSLAELRHPNIVGLVQADLASDPPYIVLDYVGDQTLADCLSLGVEEARRVCQGILAGLAFAHERGVAHLDLKPQNILMQDGEPRIADFGLARAVVDSGRSLENTLSEQKGASGTLAYMAPEQREGEPGDTRSDVYAFGLILFQALTGKLPQPGDTLSDFLSSVPTWAEVLFAQSYCRREKRFATATQLQELFDTAPSAPTRKGSPFRRRPTAQEVRERDIRAYKVVGILLALTGLAYALAFLQGLSLFPTAGP